MQCTTQEELKSRIPFVNLCFLRARLMLFLKVNSVTVHKMSQLKDLAIFIKQECEFKLKQ